MHQRAVIGLLELQESSVERRQLIAPQHRGSSGRSTVAVRAAPPAAIGGWWRRGA
jgi:hypothetical protein